MVRQPSLVGWNGLWGHKTATGQYNVDLPATHDADNAIQVDSGDDYIPTSSSNASAVFITTRNITPMLQVLIPPFRVMTANARSARAFVNWRQTGFGFAATAIDHIQHGP